MAKKRSTKSTGNEAGQAILDWCKKHKKATAAIVLVCVIIVIAGSSSGSKSPSTNKSTTTTKSAAVQPAKKAAYDPELYNIADDNNIPMIRPAAGWDNNDGWDTAAQASIDDADANAVTPAVVELNSHQLELNINVKNTGNAAGTPDCKVQASSGSGSEFATGTYYGVNYAKVTGLNGVPIQPGDFGNATDDLTITGQGALHIQQIKISC
jgi:archaellum component FlaG (FlaF/FlaG flagellin family)